jgi:hypothetical protein
MYGCAACCQRCYLLPNTIVRGQFDAELLGESAGQNQRGGVRR